MLNNAKQILISELVLAENVPQSEIEKIVENKINVSFKENRLHEDGMEAINNNIVNKFIPFDGTGTSQN